MLSGWNIPLVACLVLTVVLGVLVLSLEQPQRLDHFARARKAAVVGLALSVGAVLATSIAQWDPPTPVASPNPAPTSPVPLATVLSAVKASNEIHVVPPNLTPALTDTSSSIVGFPPSDSHCFASSSQNSVPGCQFGDRRGARTMVLYGDSHAGMWFQALDDIASRAHWKLIVLTKSGCPAAPLPSSPEGCATWQRYAIDRINRLAPNLVVISQWAIDPIVIGARYTPEVWQRGLSGLLRSIKSPQTKSVVIGDIPYSQGADCLSRATTNVQRCSVSKSYSFLPPYDNAERTAAIAEGAGYVNVTPWFCAKTCSAVIANYSVYVDGDHLTSSYSRFLEGVLAHELALD